MQAVQRQIAADLKVQPPFKDTAALEAEIARRITFIQCCLHNARLKTQFVCPRSVSVSLPASRSHTLIVLSKLPENSRLPSADSARLVTGCA